MKTIQVKSLKQNYSILVGSGLLSKSGMLLKKVFNPGCRVMLVTQKTVPIGHRKKAEASLRKAGFQVFFYYLPQDEKAKSANELFRLVAALLKNGFERGDAIFALGGGVTGDVSGFAAAVYLRGIRYVQMPTTLLAQVDSSIGGKTAVNTPEGKNLVGAFNPPAMVISDVDTLKTLPSRELRAAMAEVIKYGVIADPKLFDFLEANAKKITAKNPKALERIVSDSARIKAGVVSRDEFETKGERMILNYGHTFGHGVEGALKYQKLVHGEAVALGMLMAAEMGVRLGLCSGNFQRRQLQLIRSFDLPVSLDRLGITTKSIFRVMAHDKKKKSGKLRFVLPERNGLVSIVTGIEDAAILSVIDSLF
ncbi:MAG TPA: 3-dehydroquinate synthase [Candidatus Omnitrophica bacterium]|nr:3-dehydroquinate synthase [Candidatus Omnitrophota bacterium]